MGKKSYLGGSTILSPGKGVWDKKYKSKKLKAQRKAFDNIEDEIRNFIINYAVEMAKKKKLTMPHPSKNIKEHFKKKGTRIDKFISESELFKKIYMSEKKKYQEIIENDNKIENINYNQKKKLQRIALGEVRIKKTKPKNRF